MNFFARLTLIYRFGLSILAFGAFPVNCVAGNERPLVRQQEIKFRSWTVETREISGRLLKGIQAVPIKGKVENPILTLFGFRGSGQRLCMTFEDITGTFGAEAWFSNPPDSPSIDVALPMQKIPPSVKSRLDEVSMTAWMSARGNCLVLPSDKPEYVLPNWHGRAPTAVRFLINVPAASLARVVVEGNVQATDCREVDIVLTANPRRSIQSYNQECKVPLPEDCQLLTSFELIVDVGAGRDGAAGFLRRSCQPSQQ